MGRPPCCDKSNVKRGLWTPEEDAKILAYVSNHGTGNWTLVPKKAGLNRCGKSCRLRWTNYLRPDLKHDSFTPQEEELIIELHKAIGNRWSLIARGLPGRTDNDVKNYWNTKLRKKLTKMGIDPITHKPISQILSDYGSITGLSNTGNQNGHANKDLGKTMATRAESSSIQTGLPNANIKRKPSVEQSQEKTSWQHRPQFQVMNQETVQPHFLYEATPSSSTSSSSSNITQLSSPPPYSCRQSQAKTTAPCSSFDWSEFLLNDIFMSSELLQQEEQDYGGVLPSVEPSFLMKDKFQLSKDTDNGSAFNTAGVADPNPRAAFHENNKQSTSTESSGNSFVDAILDRDTEMRAAFPELLNGSFD